MIDDSGGLEVRNLTVRYGGEPVVKSLDLQVGVGRISGLLGPNGAGKTTLLDALYRLIPHEEGTIRWRGQLLERTDLAYLEAENYFYPMITGREYLQLFRLQNDGFDVQTWSDLFSLPLDQTVDVYSLGMRKKLALVGILSLNRPILMLDEPFNHLDLESNHLLQSILRKLADSGKTILLTSHILSTLTEICDDIRFLLDGKIEASFSREKFGGIRSWLESVKHKDKETLVGRLLGG